MAAAQGSDAAQAAPEADAALVLESLRIEDRVQSSPAEAAERMRALAEGVAEDSPLKREFLGMAGRYFASARMDDAALATAAALEQRQLRLADGSDLAAAMIRIRIAAIEKGSAHQLQAIRVLKPRVEAELTPRERLRYWYSLAGALAAAGELGDAIAAYQRASELSDQIDYPSWRATVRSGLAGVLSQFGQHQRAEELARESVAIAAELKDDVLLSDAYTTLGIVLDEVGDSEGLLAAMTLAIEHARRAGDGTSLSVLLGNVAHYHLVRHSYPEAERVSREALAVAERAEDQGGHSLALANLGLARIGQGEVEEGKALVQQSLVYEESQGRRSHVAMTHFELAQALERAGDIEAAIEAYHIARRLQDEIFREDQQRAVLALQEQIEASRREKAIEQLNVENALRAAELERNQLQQWVWRLLSVLLVLVLMLLASGVTRLRQSNRKLVGLNAQLRLQSERDPLTGLANRRQVQAALRHAGADRVFRGTLMLLDLDHFKSINDTHGHAVGDAVLVEVGRRLRTVCRGQDIAARWGGEEFLLMLEALSPEDSLQLAERLLAELARPVDCGGLKVPISTSIGFAAIPLPPASVDLSFEQSLRLVDAALYLAKLRGRHRACGITWLREVNPAALDAVLADLEHAEGLGRVRLALVLGQEG